MNDHLSRHKEQLSGQVNPKMSAARVRFASLSILSRQSDLSKSAIRTVAVMCLLVTIGIGQMWAESVAATFNSDTEITSDTYQAWDNTNWYLSKGGSQKGAGFNAKNQSTIENAYGTSANTSHGGFYIRSKNKLSNICKITFTYDFCTTAAECDAAKIYIGYSTDGSSWSAVTFTSGSQGTSISPSEWDSSSGSSYNETTWTFEFANIASAYFAVIVSREGSMTADKGFRFDDTVIDFYTGCCSNIVTPAKGTRSNCEIAFDLDEVPTCNSTAADRQIKVKLTPASCYAAPVKASVSSTGTTATWVSGPTWNGTTSTYDYVFQYAQNATGTTTFNASLSTKTTYTVSYNKGSTTYTGGNTINGSHANDTKTCGTNMSLPGATFTTTGYTQNGWATSDGGTKEYNLSITNYSVDAAATLYPTWSANETDITLNKNGGTTSGDALVDYGDASVTIVNDAVGATGYHVEGYYTNDATPVKILNADGSYAETNITGYVTGGKWTYTTASTLTLYAHWAANTYKVRFNKNNGSAIGTMDDQEFTYGTSQNLTANAFILDGNVFNGWNTQADGKGTNYTNGQSVNNLTATNNGTFNLYAKWRTATFSDYKFSCAELTLTKPDAGDMVFITSAASKTVRSQERLHIEGNGLTPGTAVTFTISPSTASGKFAFKKADGSALSTDASGEIDTDFYVYYTPGSGDTSDGLDQFTTLTASVSGVKPKTATLSGKTFIGRHLPPNFVIAAKVDGRWYALSGKITKATNPTPVAIRVDDNNDPTTAYCASTYSYTLYQDNTANSQKVILGMTNYKKDDKTYALWGSGSAATLGINGDAFVDGSLGDQYKWTFKQTATSVSSIGDVKYTMRVTNRDYDVCVRTYNSALNWGTYTSGTRVSELRLLTLTTRSAPTMAVMEWGTDALVLQYAKGGTAKSVQAVIGDGSPTAITLTGLGGDIYRTSTISGLSSNPGKTLTILTTESSTAKEKMFVIPLIVGNGVSKTEQQLREMMPGADATARNTAATLVDVVIRPGGTMTTTTASGSFANLYIYPGGKVKISNNIKVKTNIYMRGGYSFLDSKATYAYPDLCIKSGTFTAAKLYYDLYIDNRYYYTFSMPYDVTLASVTDEAGNDDFPVWVKHYNGATRASGTHVSGWEWYGDEDGQGSFFAGVGYEITAKPKVSGRPIAIIRFPVKTGNITSDASREIGVSVGNYGYDDYESGSLAANNVGWNFVGNPYLTEYKAGTASPANDTLMIVAQGYVQHIDPTTGVWDGTYDWQASNKRFITVPYDTQSDYHSEYVATYAIPAFSAFFIQTEAEGTFYMRGTRPQAAGVAPRYMQTQREKPEMHLDVLLRGDNEAVEAKAGLIIHDKYEGGLKDFEDVEQWFVDQNEQKTYTFANGTALAYNLLNEQAATQVIPMGYIATAAGEHTYSLDESNDVSGLAHLLLTDYETGLTTDLLVHDYVFMTEVGRFDERFAISAVFEQEEIVTDVAGTNSDNWTKTIGIYHDGNTLTLRGLPEGSEVYVYDMTGKLMASGENLHNVASFSIAAQGVYNIRVVSGDEAVTLRSVLQ